MSDRHKEHSFSIGSAVQFTHKGETIRGHLLQRQGRRRFAKVIDTEERTWSIPESTLEDSGGVRRATIITCRDEARADYRVGDEVTFTSSAGAKGVEIVKLNPKRAKVRCGETCWNVPYGLLSGAAVERTSNGAVRLSGVAGMACQLMDEHGLTGWTLAVRRSEEAPRRLPFQRACDPDQPQPCTGRERGAGPGHRPARDRTRARGTRGGSWSVVEGDGTAHRSNAKGVCL